MPPLWGLDISLPVDVGKNLEPWALKGCCDYFYFLQDKQWIFQLLLLWVRSQPREGYKISLRWHATEQLAGWRGPINVTRKLILIGKAGDKNITIILGAHMASFIWRAPSILQMLHPLKCMWQALLSLDYRWGGDCNPVIQAKSGINI